MKTEKASGMFWGRGKGWTVLAHAEVLAAYVRQMEGGPQMRGSGRRLASVVGSPGIVGGDLGYRGAHLRDCAVCERRLAGCFLCRIRTPGLGGSGEKGHGRGRCAFNAAWRRPDQFSKVFTTIGSFTNIRGVISKGAENGGNVFPELVMKTEKKNIRIFSQDGSRDLTNEAPVSLNRHCAWYCLLDAQA
jgi:hypothetical protein